MWEDFMASIFYLRLFVEAHHGDGAVFGDLFGLSGMKFEEIVFFREDDDEVGRVVGQVMEETFFYIFSVDDMQTGLKLPEVALPCFGLQEEIFIGGVSVSADGHDFYGCVEALV